MTDIKMNEVVAPFQRFVVRVRWNARKAGGLFLGLRVSFPVSIIYNNGEVRSTWNVNVGLLVVTVSLEFRERVTSIYDER
jgi:hypothetical protein